MPVPSRSLEDIRKKIDWLAKAAWGTREQIGHTELMLEPMTLQSADVTAMTSQMLRHVRQVAPQLNVPWLTPRVIVQRLSDAAGEFVEEDGWVMVTVGSEFFDRPFAAQAILCHELCHYVLNASGIRERRTIENERLTDAAMFVFGLGDIFTRGYRQHPDSEYRAGHRLGYLTDAEYEFARVYVQRLRRSSNRFASSNEEAERRLKAVVFDPAKRVNLVEFYRRKMPEASLNQVIDKILDDIARDNR